MSPLQRPKKAKISTLLALLLVCALYAPPTLAVDRRGRLGVGFTQQLQNEIPALSLKLQKSQAFSYSALFGINTDSDTGGYGAGVKAYRNIFVEPQLTFYMAGLAAIINKKRGTSADQDGFQVDLSLGSEFSFAGLKSLGFSFEFGVSMSKLDEFRMQTLGNHVVTSAIHFYL